MGSDVFPGCTEKSHVHAGPGTWTAIAKQGACSVSPALPCLTLSYLNQCVSSFTVCVVGELVIMLSPTQQVQGGPEILRF